MTTHETAFESRDRLLEDSPTVLSPRSRRRGLNVVAIIALALLAMTVAVMAVPNAGADDESVEVRSLYVPDGYQPTWNDEFDDLSLDVELDGGERWLPQFSRWNALSLADNGDQCMKYSPTGHGVAGRPHGMTTHEVADGVLTLFGQQLPNDRRAEFWGYEAACGMISSELSHTQTYGYWETRVRIADISRGQHWGIWMVRENGDWPPEIDLLEVVGTNPANGTDQDFFHFNAHAIDASQNASSSIVAPNGPNAWHTIGLEWTADAVVWFVDGNEVQRTANFAGDEPMYLLMTAESSGNWPGSTNDTTRWPMALDVDYVRVYEGTPTVSASFVMITPERTEGSDGWFSSGSGTRQWVSGACRTRLEASGVERRVLDWDSIASIPDTGATSCPGPEDSAGGECVDPEGDGWGWRGVWPEGESCQVDPDPDPELDPAPTPTPVADPEDLAGGECVDPEGDGWGWRGVWPEGESCQVDPDSDPELDPAPTPTPDRDDASTVNSVQTVVDDMRLLNDLKLVGVNPAYGFSRGPGINTMGNIPSGANLPAWYVSSYPAMARTGYWKSIIPWFVLFEGEGHSSQNSRVQMRNMKLYILRRSTNEWALATSSQDMDGHFCPHGSNYLHCTGGDNTRNEASGGVSLKPMQGHDFHGWYGGRLPIDGPDIKAVFVTLQGRLIVNDPTLADDRTDAKYLFDVGADYYPELGQSDIYLPGVGVSRAKLITSDWRSFNFLTFDDVGLQDPGGGITEAEFRTNPPPLD